MTNRPMNDGWFQLGFARDYERSITPVDCLSEPLMVINIDGKLSVYSATCPHRGANLGHGGVLESNGVRCPFHGCKIGLDAESEDGLMTKKLESLQVAGLLFVARSRSRSTGFVERIQSLDNEYMILPGFQIEIAVDPITVIENAFDQMHFKQVHSINNKPIFDLLPSRYGEFAVSGELRLPASAWQRTSVAADVVVPYHATAFSPYIVVSSLGGENPYVVITSAREFRRHRSMVSLSIGIPASRFDANDAELYRYLIDKSREGIRLDAAIWENIGNSANRLFRSEKAVIGFQSFCRSFVEQDFKK
jgi:3-ketosteroid 9alpha-monooxygenase subunit A